MLPVCAADFCLPHCSIPSLFYLIFVHLFALSRQASYRLPFAIDRLIDMIHPKLLRLTHIHAANLHDVGDRALENATKTSLTRRH
jgi:hypothetical protein